MSIDPKDIADRDLESMLSGLADKGLVKVWLLMETDGYLPLAGEVPLVHASLSGAIVGARELVLDQLVPLLPEGIDPSTRKNYVSYLADDVTWQWAEGQEISNALGTYNIEVRSPQGVTFWSITSQELLP
jgi:hypothetical protein